MALDLPSDSSALRERFKKKIEKMNKTFHIHIFKYKGKKKNGRGRKGKKEKRKKKHRRKLEMKERATEKQKRKERSVSCLQQHGQDAACRETTSDTS